MIQMKGISEKNFKGLETMIRSFLWRGAQPRIKYETLIMNKECGGVGVIDVRSQVCGLMVMWVKRLLCGSPSSGTDDWSRRDGSHPVEGWWPDLARARLNARLRVYGMSVERIFHQPYSAGLTVRRALGVFWRQVFESWQQVNGGCQRQAGHDWLSVGNGEFRLSTVRTRDCALISRRKRVVPLRTIPVWNQELGTSLCWSQVFINVNSSELQPSWRDLQYKVIAHGLPLRSRLHRENETLSELCPCCGLSPETDLHFLFECAKAKEMWEYTRVLLHRKLKFSGCVDLRIALTGQPAPSLWWSRLSPFRKKLFRGVVAAGRWTVWVQRNKFLLDASPPSPIVVRNVFNVAVSNVRFRAVCV
jgi:hypothetical protein